MNTIKRRFASLFLLGVLPLLLLAGCNEEEQAKSPEKSASQAQAKALANIAKQERSRAEGLEEDLSVATALAYCTGFVAILFIALLGRERSAKRGIQRILHFKSKEDSDGKHHN